MTKVSKRNTNIQYYIPPILWAGLIFLASSRRHIIVSRVYWINFTFFKFLHVVEYAILFILIYRAFRNTTSLSMKKSGFLSFFLTIIYAITDEIHQTLVPTRDGRIRDVGFDTIGATLAWILVWKSQLLLPKKLTTLLDEWQIL